MFKFSRIRPDSFHKWKLGRVYSEECGKTVGPLIEQRSYFLDVRSQMIGLSTGSRRDSGFVYLESLLKMEN